MKNLFAALYALGVFASVICFAIFVLAGLTHGAQQTANEFGVYTVGATAGTFLAGFMAIWWDEPRA